ncbi:MAG: alpha-amylase family glycosyl hydrolase [Acidimicrobiales bacterium]
MTPAPPWWESALVYQIYPRSFCDTDGDGVGDLAGIEKHLDHIAWLGATAIWLSPFYRSPMCDFGYDVAEYCDVDALFGTLEDFDRLVAAAHARDLRVIIDWVPNHTSDQHPWFHESRSSRHSAKRNWYWWRDGRSDADGGHGPPGSPGRLPNNWRAAFPGIGGKEFPPAWSWDAGTKQWYLHLFLAEQPDLNWNNPEVRRAMAETLRFWMARGADGFRVDVIHGLGKDPSLADLPPEMAAVPISALNDQPATHPIIAELRSVIDSWPATPARMMVGEVYLPTTEQVATYYGTAQRPEVHLAFNFPPLFAPWDAGAWKQCIDDVHRWLDPSGAWPTWVLSNHDNRRHRTRYGDPPDADPEARARAAAILLATLRGTPFFYAGEELGLHDARVPPQQRVDPGGRDGCRAPIPWDSSSSHGWPSAQPWLPWPPEADTGRTVEQLRGEPGSILYLYRRVISARRASPALTHGDFEWISSPKEVLAYQRRAAGDERLVAVNFSDQPCRLDPPPGAWGCELSSLRGPATAGDPFELRPHEALIWRPVPATSGPSGQSAVSC